MKVRFLNFLKKYKICFLLSVIMVMGLSLTTRYAYLYESGDYISFDLRELYLVCIVPLYSIAYGCLSYTIFKKIWFPQLIIFVIAFAYWFRFDTETLDWPGTYIWSVYPVVFSLVGTFITAFIFSIVKSIKKNKNQEP